MTTFSAGQNTPYRNIITVNGLLSFPIIIKETNILIFSDTLLEIEAKDALLNYRYHIEEYIRNHANFLSSLIPLPLDESAPPIIKDMLHAGQLAGVGPMASVAGALAENIGNKLLAHSQQIVVENGGDIYLHLTKDATVAIYAGDSPLSNKLGLKIPSETAPLGVCTSSGTVGHSLSQGKADAATIVAKSTSLADAVATATGNLIKGKKDIEKGLAYTQTVEGVIGTLIIADDQFRMEPQRTQKKN